MSQQDQEGRRRDLFGRLQVGDVVTGTVSGLASYGAFVQIGEAPGPYLSGDGLIHISELSWGRVSRVTDVVRLGERVGARVIALNPERNQILLSLRELQDGPAT
jgi:small subunit ribosomal protein S1